MKAKPGSPGQTCTSVLPTSAKWQPWTEMHFCPAYLCQVPLLDNITRKSLCTAASVHSFFRDLCLHSARAFTFMHITLFHLWDGSIVLMCLFHFAVFFFLFCYFQSNPNKLILVFSLQVMGTKKKKKKKQFTHFCPSGQ